jgi:hypothetical protein
MKNFEFFKVSQINIFGSCEVVRRSLGVEKLFGLYAVCSDPTLLYNCVNERKL